MARTRKRKVNGLVFEVPPSHRIEVEPVWVTRLKVLKPYPKRWVKLIQMKSPGSAWGTRSMLENGKVKIPAGRFEFAISGSWVYARYLGA